TTIQARITRNRKRTVKRPRLAKKWLTTVLSRTRDKRGGDRQNLLGTSAAFWSWQGQDTPPRIASAASPGRDFGQSDLHDPRHEVHRNRSTGRESDGARSREVRRELLPEGRDHRPARRKEAVVVLVGGVGNEELPARSQGGHVVRDRLGRIWRCVGDRLPELVHHRAPILRQAGQVLVDGRRRHHSISH